MMSIHHPIFEKFRPFQGIVAGGFIVDFAGICVDPRFFDPSASFDPTPKPVQTTYPICGGEGYFDLIAVARTVDDSRSSFVIVELGAGYGYWLAEGGALARQRGLEVRLIGVEADPGHFAMMQQHLRTNGFNPSQHTLIEAAIAPTDGVVYFAAGESHKWWGQAVVSRPDISIGFEGAVVREVRSVSLNSILARAEAVDVLHMDVQGVELAVLQSAIESVRDKVRTLIVGTHSREIEHGLRNLFTGWNSLFDFPMGQVNSTEYGDISFGDGVQIWENPARLL
jgi:FkbM family methyltransferase